MQKLVVVLCLSISSFSLEAQSRPVVASTAWTAAFARAAGAREVAIIAPLDLKHPPEYEIKPSDLKILTGAGLVIFAGYEKFAQRLAETAGPAGIETLRIATDNAPEAVKLQTRRIAEKLGTLEAQAAWAPGFDALTLGLRRRVQSAWPVRRAAVQKMQRSVAEWLGFEIAGEFGPGELTSSALAALARAKPALVIDNYHNPSGKPLADALGCAYVQLINFPGKDGTRSLEEVWEYNARVLAGAAGR
jgi:hypothetical protein